jgi:hypothetical protein
MRGTGSSSSFRPVPRNGSSSRADSSFVIARTSAMPVMPLASATARSTSASVFRFGVGRTWIVTSRDTSLRQFSAERLTSSTAPTVSDARNVMMPTTATSARPEIELRGTIGDSKRGGPPPLRGGDVTSVIASSLIS